MFCFSPLAWVRTLHACILCTRLLSKLLCSKTFYFFSLRQCLRALGTKWGTPGPWEVQIGSAVIAQLKVVDKFLKVCVEGRGLASVPGHSGPCKPLGIEHSVPPFLCQTAENMICTESGDLPPSTAIALIAT